jgi:hypothetical protein
MKRLLLLFSILISFNSYGEINNRAFLETIFNECSSPGPDFDELAQLIGVGGVFEYCGCTVNEMSKNMDLRDMVQLGVDALAVGFNPEEEISNEQLSLMFKNEQFSNAVVECMTNALR